MTRRRSHIALTAIAVAAALALGGLAACHGPADAQATSQSPSQRRIAVAVAAARMQPLTRTAEVQGALYPKERATLAADVDGTVAEVDADFGDSVAAGQVLLKVDPREAL